MNLKATLTQTGSVTLRWENPVGAARVALVRKERDFPRSLADREKLLDSLTLPTTFEDSEARPGALAYYRLFFQKADGSWVAEEEGHKTRLFVAEPFGFADWLSDNLPDITTREDETNLISRLLAITAGPLERMRAMQESFSSAMDPDGVREDLLEALSWNVGWTLNRELPVLRQRAELANAVALYRRKGTRAGLLRLVHAVVGWPAEVITYARNILMTGVPGLTTLAISDPLTSIYMGTADDQADYLLGGDHTPDHIRLRLLANGNFELFNRVRHKLLRVLHLFVPACMRVTLEVATTGEELGGVSETRPPAPDLLERNWLITSSYEVTTPNPEEAVVFGPRVTGDPLWRTWRAA